jgi:hypothetical protein
MAFYLVNLKTPCSLYKPKLLLSFIIFGCDILSIQYREKVEYPP